MTMTPDTDAECHNLVAAIDACDVYCARAERERKTTWLVAGSGKKGEEQTEAGQNGDSQIKPLFLFPEKSHAKLPGAIGAQSL